MRFRPGGLLEGDRIIGHHGATRCGSTTRRRKHTTVVLEVDHLPDNIHIGARTWGDLVGADPLRIGEDRFDQTVRVSGPPDEVLARLPARARGTLESLVGASTHGASVVVTGGRVIYDVEYRVVPAAGLERIVRQLGALADALRLDDDVPTQLGAHARDPQEPTAVRRQNLRALLTCHADHPEADATSDALLDASDPVLQLMAAAHRVRTPDGRRVLRRLLADRSLSDTVRVQALRAIEPGGGTGACDDAVATVDRVLAACESSGPHDPLDGVLSDILADPSPAVRQAVAETLVARRTSEPRILVGLANDPSAPVASVALRGLARVFETPPLDLSAVLISALRRRAYDVRLAAVEALGVNGTVAAIEPLRSVLRASFFDQRLRSATRTALCAIQTRAGHGGPGHLSLALDDDGRGMVSEVSSGGLSEARSLGH